jgi:L-lactate dehydrogenase complex protein LldG
VGASGSPCEALATEVNAVGGQANIVDGWDAARETVTSLLHKHSARAALCWKHVVLDRLGLAELLAANGVRRYDYDALCERSVEEQRGSMLAADIGISSVDLAVAETGTLVMCSKPGQERVASLAPPVHLALVDQRQIVPDLFDVFDELARRGVDSLPSNLVFNTGPSKTGDIELRLTTGVHGPKHWHVVVVRGTEF